MPFPSASPRVGAMASPPIRGIVLAVQANFYQVRLEGDYPCPTLLCTRRARLKKMGQQVMVGDRVTLAEPDWAGGRGAIAAIDPRQTELDRPPVANANQVLLVFSLAEPDLDPHQLTRFLVKAETTGMVVTLVLNKQDLVPPETISPWRDRLRGWGYDPYFLSVSQQDPWPLLGERLQGCTTVLSGPSGVGKSSLINRLIPAAQLRTGQVSGKLARGRHTTRHVELFALPRGGLLADTPGFNQPDVHCTPEELGQYFPEIRQRQGKASCQFADCLHQGEPGCAIGHDWERHGDYVTLLQECQTQAQAPDGSGGEAGFKAKAGAAGQVYHEPRLQAKKYRRPSRRRRHQSLQELRHEFTDGNTPAEVLDALEEGTWDDP